jgi:hypothetical protein
MTYNQYPYVITFKDYEAYNNAYTWLLTYRTGGLWVADYSQACAIKFTLKEDAVIIGLKFS